MVGISNTKGQGMGSMDASMCFLEHQKSKTIKTSELNISSSCSHNYKVQAVWLGPQLWSLRFWRQLFCALWFQPQAGFASLVCYQPPLGSAALFFLVREQGKRPQLSTDWITVELSAEIHGLIGLDLSNQAPSKST